MQTCGSSGRSYDYGMMRMMVERCANALVGHLKMKPGEKIGLILPNIPEFVVLIHGAMKAGLVVTFANPLYTAGYYYVPIIRRKLMYIKASHLWSAFGMAEIYAVEAFPSSGSHAFRCIRVIKLRSKIVLFKSYIFVSVLCMSIYLLHEF